MKFKRIVCKSPAISVFGVESWPKAHYTASMLYPDWNHLVTLTFVFNWIEKWGLNFDHTLDNENPTTQMFGAY